MTADVVFLLDVDNTLLDNDRVLSDLREHLENGLGPVRAQCYWEIFNGLREALGYVDYLGAFQRLRSECEAGDPEEQRLMQMAAFLIDYPFTERLYPNALDALSHLGRFGQTVLLSDGDAVLQPRKLKRSGLLDAVEGRALIYVHKQQRLDAVERHYPACRYVMVEDKLRILTAMKAIWHERLTTIFVRQGHYALDPTLLAGQPAADLTIERIGELADLDPLALIQWTAENANSTQEMS